MNLEKGKVSKKQKIVIFDLFGVIIDSHSKTKYNVHDARRDIANDCKFDINIFSMFFKDAKFGITNGKDFDDLIKEYINKCKSNIDINRFKESYIKYYGKVSCYEKVIKFIENLQDKNYKTAILSKLCVLDKIYLGKNINLSRFDNLFFSCDLGMEKPDVKVFEYVSRETGIEGKNILFIDDSIKNIDAARELGWNVCNATGDEFDKIKETVEEFLMKD